MNAPSDLFTPGQLWQRIMATLLVPLSLWRAFEWWSHDGPLWLVVVCGISAFIFVALSIPPFYAAWMRFGEEMNRVVMIAIFGVIYILLLPFLLIFVVPKNRLKTRAPSKITSFWEKQTERNDEIREMMRMG